MITKIVNAIAKFKLNLKNKIVITEAATGNYVVTPIIAALAGAEVYAFTKSSRFGTTDEVVYQTNYLSKKLNISHKIHIVNELNNSMLSNADILTNTGFLRPINKNIIENLNNKCVIPLMWEPWEFREEDIDLEACIEKGIKVYGTNESDFRLRTIEYIGFTILYFLLQFKLSPFSAKVLLVGCNKFVNPVKNVLLKNNYEVEIVSIYQNKINTKEYNAIILLEHQNDILLIGSQNSFINKNDISSNQVVIHICGNVDFTNSKFIKIPEKPARFGYMSFTTDYIDNMAVIDLHTAGLKVAEGMLKAKHLGLQGLKYKNFMESNYPALAFKNEKYW